VLAVPELAAMPEAAAALPEAEPAAAPPMLASRA